MSGTDRTELLRAIKDEVLNLNASPLYAERIKNKVLPVVGDGNSQAKIMFIGEAPGKNEAQTGRPFMGSAGKILDELLLSVGINRSDVYITNIVKDRPPLNRDPSSKEIAVYSPFLDREIEIIQPKVIVTLGRFPMEYVLRKFGLASKLNKISKVHGTKITAQASYGSVDIVLLYHPTASTYGHRMRKTAFEDFKILKDFV